MKYKVDGEDRKIEFKFDKITIKEFIEKANENRESVIVKVNGKVKTEFDSISEGDEIELIKITSGG
jgi:sulfur carrier protein ThiS